MRSLPQQPNLAHLKKQAKALLRAGRAGEADASARFATALPAAFGRAGDTAMALRLHDAQSCIAREYGFPSWAELTRYVEARAAGATQAHGERVRHWLELVYAGDATGVPGPARPQLAARLLAEAPELAGGSPYLACAVGDERSLRQATAADRGWANRLGGPLNLPPLVAVTHSSLLQLPAFRAGLVACARHLLDAGADPNQRIGNRFPPALLARPDDGQPLSALYGAAGVNRDPELTSLLLEAGANPNDGESLYHSLESPECTRLLLERGARISGTNALYRALDLPALDALETLLAYGADANESTRHKPLTDWGSPLLWAIRRRRSPAHVAALLAAGADPAARTPDGIGAYRLAQQFGLPAVADLLREAGADEALSEEEAFVAACARGDEAAARRIQAQRPDLPASLPPHQLRLLPELVSDGQDAAARLMVRLGWPVAVRGGDWSASALNLAVFRGDAALAAFLLEHGASWREAHGYGSDVAGTLGWASCHEPVAGGDWVGCARVLLAHGMPKGERDSAAPDIVVVDGRRMRFSDEVSEVLLGVEESG